MNALVIDSKDTVAVVIEPIKKGDNINCLVDGVEKNFPALDDVIIYHKIAVTEMKKGEPVVKYGEHIGIAGTDIKVGNYVHVHNVEDHREDLGGN